MARRRVPRSHAIAGESLRSSEFEGRVTHTGDALCGDGFAWPKERTSEAVAALNVLATCPACSKKWGAAKLARAEGRVRLEPWAPSPEELAARGRTAEFKPYRSAWRVFVDDVERAAIVNEHGFGTPWEIRELKEFEPRGYTWHGRIVGAAPGRYSYGAEPIVDGVGPIHRASKEAAAFACIALAEAGKLPTLEEQAEQERQAAILKAEREAERQREAEEMARERERKEAERLERLETARLALAELEGRPDLSNLELAGLAAIRALLGLESGDE